MYRIFDYCPLIGHGTWLFDKKTIPLSLSLSRNTRGVFSGKLNSGINRTKANSLDSSVLFICALHMCFIYPNSNFVCFIALMEHVFPSVKKIRNITSPRKVARINDDLKNLLS